jgi:prevent-host-death family protein
MSTVTVAGAKNHFSDLLRRAEYVGERIVVSRHGKPVAAIISTGDLHKLNALEDGQDVADAQAALAEADAHGTVPLEAVLAKHGLSHLLGPTDTAVPRAARKGAPKRRRASNQSTAGKTSATKTRRR